MNNVFGEHIADVEFSRDLDTNIRVFNVNIYHDQAIADLQALEYILTTAYSGKDYWGNHGVHVREQVLAIAERLDGKPRINVAEFFEYICDALQNIRDAHLIFSLPYFDRRHVFCQHKAPYFAETVLKKSGSQFVVAESKEKCLPVGTIVMPCEANLFPTLGVNDERTFLYGVLSETPVQTVELQVGTSVVSLPLQGAAETSRNRSIWQRDRVRDVDIVKIHRLTTFSDEDESAMRELIAFGTQLANAKKLVIDLRGNAGGYFQHAQQFIKNLNGVAVSNVNYAKLDSQPSRLCELSTTCATHAEYVEKKAQVLSDNTAWWRCADGQDVPQGSYAGQLSVVTDRYTASSAEITVKCLRDNIRNCKIVGENTSGCLNTGDIRYFYLPHSLIFLNIPTAIFAGIFEEGSGFLPDYWIKGSNWLEQILDWMTGDQR